MQSSSQQCLNIVLLFTSLDYDKGRHHLKAGCSSQSRPGAWIFPTKPKWPQWTLTAWSDWKGMPCPLQQRLRVCDGRAAASSVPLQPQGCCYRSSSGRGRGQSRASHSRRHSAGRCHSAGMHARMVATPHAWQSVVGYMPSYMISVCYRMPLLSELSKYRL